MFFFMEGLPRSGKSYETASEYILKALKEGRPIDAYIEGLNHEQFAELAEITIEECQELLVVITREQVKEIYKYARKDAIVVIDELQNFFPAGRTVLPDEITKFITEHGHEGQDIIGMGQDLEDVHKMWRNRCGRKFVFQKQDAIGRPTHYKWTAYQAERGQKAIKWVKINSGVKKYDEKYFGLYKSHNDGVSNFDSFKDDRTNLFKNKSFLLYLPVFIGILIFAGIYVNGIFTGDGLVKVDKESSGPSNFEVLEKRMESQAPKTVTTSKITTLEPKTLAPTIIPPKADDNTPDGYLRSVIDKYKLRLQILVVRKNKPLIARIQAFDNTFHVKELFTADEIKALGWDIVVTGYGIDLVKDETRIVVRSWPIDPYGKVNQETISQL